VSLSVRAARGQPAQLAPRVAAALSAIDGNLAFTLRPLTDDVSVTLAQERLLAALAGFFGALGLLLAGLGLYGVTTYAVTRRRRELGIRLAPGAAPRTVMRIVLSRVALLVAAGVAVGGAASLWLSRFVTPLLYGLEPRDPVTLAGAMVTLILAAAIAAAVPAYRASRVDPATVLREN
jgi:ABC-type antimicrobial peptide transport system permease subunit